MTADPKSLQTLLTLVAADLRRFPPFDEAGAGADICQQAATALEAQAALLEEARAVLADFAAQELSADMSVDDQLGGDFEGAYNHMIELARAYLAKTEPT